MKMLDLFKNDDLSQYPYVYYVVYNFQCGSQSGTGTSEIRFKKEPTTYGDIREFAKEIANNNDNLEVGDIVILNYKLLRVEGKGN